MKKQAILCQIGIHELISHHFLMWKCLQDWLDIIEEDKMHEPFERPMVHSEAYLSGSAARKKRVT